MILTELDLYMKKMASSNRSPREMLSGEHFRLPEYQRCIAPFLDDAAALEWETRPYRETYVQEFHKAKACAVRFAYGKGSMYLPMEYYCPDPVEDMVVSNAKRGRIIQKISQKTKPDTVYGFDSENRLVTIEDIGDPSEMLRKAVLIYQEQQAMCLYYNEHGQETHLSVIYKMEYEQDRLRKMVEISPYAPRHVEIKEFTYAEEGLQERVLTQVCVHPQGASFVLRSALRFVHDEDGLLAGYYVSWNNGKSMDEAPCIEEIPKNRRRCV